MKNIKAYIIAIMSATLLFTSCESFTDAIDTKEVKYLTVKVKVSSLVPGVEAGEGWEVVFVNVKDGSQRVATLMGEETVVDSILPGSYNINIAGESISESGDSYLMKGNKQNYILIRNQDLIEISLNGLRESPIVFSEIFYAGTTPTYFRNQFYELYNVTDRTIYLDGLHFANLVPLAPSLTNLPVWPTDDDGKYVYAERVWKFPGDGKTYPLEPGQSCVLAQFAVNHKQPQYSPNSPVDCFTADFEFNMDTPKFPDQPAEDMEHVFYNGQAIKGTLTQYLTSVFGGGYVIFKPLEGEPYDPVGNKDLQTRNLGTTAATLYAKIPLTYVLDAVECGQNGNMLQAKRIPSALDAGMTYVGASYNSLGVARKKIGTTPNGFPIFQDTNNSSDDFDRGVVPMFRRHGSKMPSWNHTLKGK